MVTEVTRHQVRRLLDEGAQLVDVLDVSEFEDSRLPGALHIPLGELAEAAPSRLDLSKPTIVYCYDSVCDMSSRGARRLETLGFADVYDYVASKMDWLGAGLPFEGRRADEPHLATLAEANVPTCGLDETVADVRGKLGNHPFCVVVDDHEVVLGIVRAEALAIEGRHVDELMQEAPRTVRPHVSAAEMSRQLDDSPQPWLLVTNLDGRLVGVADPDAVRQAARDRRAHAA